jgi:hypothetical protein
MDLVNLNNPYGLSPWANLLIAHPVECMAVLGAYLLYRLINRTIRKDWQ